MLVMCFIVSSFDIGNVSAQTMPQFTQSPYWEHIASLPFGLRTFQGPSADTGGEIDGIYFFDTLHGVVSAQIDSGINDAEYIFYTSDTRTWRQVVLPRSVTQINAIRLIDGKLYVACFGPDLLVSTDSGATWSFSGLNDSDAWDVYADRNDSIQTLHYLIAGVSQIYANASFAQLDRLHFL